MAKPFFSIAPARVLAHRGLAVVEPENTLGAFAAAVKVGVTYIETDVNASSDGVSVVSHDPDLTRVAARPGAVGSFTMAQLRAVDLGGGQGFCSLADALDAFPDARFNIDIKSADAVGPTVAAIRSAAAIDRVLVTSFGETRRRAAVAALPGVATSASASRFAWAFALGKLGATPLLRRALRGLDAVQIPERALGLATTTERMIEQLHSAGVEVHIWTINDPMIINQLLGLGVDGIVTDRADLAVPILDRRAP